MPVQNIASDANRVAPEFQSLMTQYNVNVPGVVEAIWQPRFDTLPYLAAGQTQMKFFQRPSGAAGVTEDLTNMQLAGTLPAPQQFLITGVRLEFLPAADITQIDPASEADLGDYANDVQTVMRSGVVVFSVGNKEQNRDAPIGKFPPSHRLFVNTSIADQRVEGAGQISGSAYAQSTGQLYNITPTNVPYSQNFDVEIKWPVAVPLPSGNDGTVRCHLEGYLYRSAQ